MEDSETQPPVNLTREEWVERLTAQSKRFRTAMAIAGLEQNIIEKLIRDAEKAAVLTPAEIQMILLARGGEG
jgi:hypothetical protein